MVLHGGDRDLLALRVEGSRSVDKGGAPLASFACHAASDTLMPTDTLKRFNSFGISE